MGAIITEIKIPDDSYSFILEENKGHMLKNLSKVNIFVGENNSGKSRFLRSIVAKKDFEFIPSDESLKKLNMDVPDLNLPDNNILKKLNSDLLSLKRDSEESLDKYEGIKNHSPISRIIQDLEAIHPFFLIPEKENYLEELKNFKNFVNTLSHQRGSTTGGFSHNYISDDFSERITNSLGHWGSLDSIKLNYKFTKLYIPILRGLRPLQGNDKDFYVDRTKNDYFNPGVADDKRIIFSGISAYKTINTYSRLNPETRGLLEEFKEYLSNNFFDKQKVEITAAVDENGIEKVLAVKIGDEHEKPIYDLGDGIQSIIILTLQLFLHKNENLLVFIEEPEQLLHPGLQRKLIETFLYQEGFENFQFFFTTHSNHFLDITLDFEDISIFTVKKELDHSDNQEKVPKFTIENLSEGDTSALELLGVRNSSVFLSNCTLWVEGITDRHYLRHYLHLYQEKFKGDPEFIEFKEDYHYSFVEYGGNNITHWSFLDKEKTPINVEKLCGRLFLLADKDQGKEERHEKLKDKLGKDRVHILKCKEIENLVTPKILLKIVKDYEQIPADETAAYIDEDINYTDYKNRLLGRFIEKKIIINKDEMKRKGYMAKSGTIKNKESFLKKATTYIQEWDDLSQEAQEICKELYNFIKINNS